MKTIALFSGKGGAGKTTLAVHLVGCALHTGLTVALIDLDPQGSAFDWYDARPASDRFVATAAAIEALPGLIDRSRDGGLDLVILDLPPHSNRIAAAAIGHADLAVVPCRPGRFDLKAVRPTMEVVKLTRTPAVIVLNAVCARGKLADEAAAALQGQGFEVAPVMVQQRVALSHSALAGQTVHEYEPAGPAAKNIEDLFSNIKKRLKI